MTATGPRRPVAVVFDCDGVLVDSAATWDGAFVHAAAALERTLSPAQLGSLRGCSMAAAARAVASWSGRPETAPRLRQLLHDKLRKAVAKEPPGVMPGASETVSRLRGVYRLAVSSNAPRDVLQTTLRAVGLASFMDLVVSADDVARPKPAPDVYRTACLRLGVAAADAVAIEDPGLGAAAAIAAGLPTVLVTPDVAEEVAPPQDAFRSVRQAVSLRVPSLDDARLVKSILSGLAAPARAART